MIVKSVHIKKFRAFEDITIELGERVTAIVGQNGTLKSTLLGIIAQPFSLKGSPLAQTRGIDGKQLQSKFADKFKLSKKHDNVEDYVWTLNFCDTAKTQPYTSRGEYRSDTPTGVRFWNVEGGRKEGSGFVRFPVIFLSLKRLTPLGEEKKFKRKKLSIDADEMSLYQEWHNNILSIPDQITKLANIVSSEKNTLAPETNLYDAMSVSAGQDNIGKVIMSILSFRRLQLKNPDDYHGGLLLIDEIDSTLFPSAQTELIDLLFKVAEEFKIQIIFTTHSLTSIKGVYDGFKVRYNRFYGKVVSLRKVDGNIETFEPSSYGDLAHHLSITTPEPESPLGDKMRIYCEDPEARWFAKKMLKGHVQQFAWLEGMTLGCSNYKNLIEHHVPEFLKNIIILDGDAILNKKTGKKIDFPKKSPIVLLPGDGISPEELFYSFLDGLNEQDEFWTNHYTKQFCFKKYHGCRPANRDQFKAWFRSQMLHWGKNGASLFNKWANFSEENKQAIKQFQNSFMVLYKRLTGKQFK